VLDFLGERLHRLCRDLSACTARTGRLGLVQHHQDFEPLAFTLLPERQGFLNGVGSMVALLAGSAPGPPWCDTPAEYLGQERVRPEGDREPYSC
jgi:hypothetical protein